MCKPFDFLSFIYQACLTVVLGLECRLLSCFGYHHCLYSPTDNFRLLPVHLRLYLGRVRVYARCCSCRAKLGQIQRYLGPKSDPSARDSYVLPWKLTVRCCGEYGDAYCRSGCSGSRRRWAPESSQYCCGRPLFPKVGSVSTYMFLSPSVWLADLSFPEIVESIMVLSGWYGRWHLH